MGARRRWGRNREFRRVSQRRIHFHDGVDFSRGVSARQVAAVVRVEVTVEHAKNSLDARVDLFRSNVGANWSQNCLQMVLSAPVLVR